MAKENASRVDNLLASLARTLISRRWIAALTFFGLAAASVFVIGQRLRVDNSIEGLFSGDLKVMRDLEAVEAVFGSDETFVVVVRGDVFSRDFQVRLAALHDEIESMALDLPSLGMRNTHRTSTERGDDDVETSSEVSELDWADFGDSEETGVHNVFHDVVSLVSLRHLVAAGASLQAEKVVPRPFQDGNTNLIRKRLHALGFDELVNAGGDRTLILAQADFMSEQDSALLSDELQRVIERHTKPNFTMSLTGVPVTEVELNLLSSTDIANLSGLSLLVILLWMGVLFRSFLGAAVPVAVVVLSVLFTFACMALADVPVTSLSGILTSFLLCVGIGDAVHVQSVFRDQRASGVSASDAAVAAVRAAGTPILFTSLTTMAGLLSFRVSALESIRNVGTFGAVGIAAALFLSVTMVPVLLSFHRKGTMGRKKEDSDGITGFLASLSNFSRSPRGRAITVASCAMLFALGLGSALGIEAKHDPMEWVPNDHAVNVNLREMDAHFGGMAELIIHIELEDEVALTDPKFVAGLRDLERHILNYRDRGGSDAHMVTASKSILNLWRQSWATLLALKADTPQSEPDAPAELPSTARQLGDALTFLELSMGSELDRYLSTDRTELKMLLRVKWREAGAYRPFAEYVNEGANRYLAGLATVTATGSTLASMEAVSGLVGDLAQSAGTAFLLVAGLIALFIGDLRLALLAMIPNILPVVLVLGVMGALGVPLDLASLLVSAIVLGIAVDDTIHFLHHFKRSWRETADVESAIDLTLRHCGRALVLTSLILTCGFAVYGAAYLASTQRFGWLVSLAVLFALLADVWLMPALLRVVFGRGTTVKH